MSASAKKPVGYETELETVLTHDAEDYTRFQPCVVSIPSAGDEGRPAVPMTLSRHLGVSEFPFDLCVMRSRDFGVSCTERRRPPELDRVVDGGVAVMDHRVALEAPHGTAGTGFCDVTERQSGDIT